MCRFMIPLFKHLLCWTEMLSLILDFPHETPYASRVILTKLSRSERKNTVFDVPCDKLEGRNGWNDSQSWLTTIMPFW